MKKVLFALIAALSFNFTACSNFYEGWVHISQINLPIKMGVKYLLEDDLYLIIVTSDKGGIDVKLDGTSKHVKSIKNGYEITSPNTGNVYQVITDENGEPAIYMVASDGTLEPYTPPTTNE